MASGFVGAWLVLCLRNNNVEGVDLTASILEERLERVLVKTQQRGFMLELLYALQQVVLVKPAMSYL